jgi:Protein of unknown function (DUF3710)
VFRRRRREDADQAGRASGSEQDEYDELDELDDDEFAEPDEDELADGPFDEYEQDDDELDDEEEPDQDGRPAAVGEDLGDPATWTRLRDSVPDGPGMQDAGPWDAATGFPEGERMDFGSLLVPVRDGFDIQVNLDEEAGIWIAVVHGDSALQLQAFAAPKRSGIWDDVREEIAAEVDKSGGSSQEQEGPFGPELLARLSQPAEPGGRPVPQTLRFMGADGPRWFLRGLITGSAAQRPAAAQPFEEIFADVVVVRGDHAEPPRKALDIALPEEARQVIEQQMEAEGMPNPFERGPEITEIH